MAFAIFTKWFSSDPVHWTLFKNKKTLRSPICKVCPTVPVDQAGVVMSGYTVVLTGNLFDHVLRKILRLPSWKWPWRVESFFWRLWMVDCMVVSFHFWISSKTNCSLSYSKMILCLSKFPKKNWNFLEFCQFSIELTSLTAAN